MGCGGYGNRLVACIILDFDIYHVFPRCVVYLRQSYCGNASYAVAFLLYLHPIDRCRNQQTYRKRIFLENRYANIEDKSKKT